jgi:hypothetical protein
MPKYYVSRQSYWGVEPEDQYCVEIAEGGLDYANCDMLVAKYSEEGEYDDSVEAAEAAIAVREQWQKDSPELYIRIDYGYTNGFTMPFLDDNSDEEIREWAKLAMDKLPKCARCGKPFEGNSGWTHKFVDDFVFCSEYCSEEDYYNIIKEMEEEDDE